MEVKLQINGSGKGTFFLEEKISDWVKCRLEFLIKCLLFIIQKWYLKWKEKEERQNYEKPWLNMLH